MRDAENVLRTLETLPGRRLVALYDSLTRDSSTEALQTRPGARRLLFRGANTCLELHLELQPQKRRVILEGQLSDLSNPLRSISSAPVLVRAQGAPSNVAWSDRHGSFDLLIKPVPATSLWIGVKDHRLELSLDPWILQEHLLLKRSD